MVMPRGCEVVVAEWAQASGEPIVGEKPIVVKEKLLPVRHDA
jgi:hypothetical protein